MGDKAKEEGKDLGGNKVLEGEGGQNSKGNGVSRAEGRLRCRKEGTRCTFGVGLHGINQPNELASLLWTVRGSITCRHKYCPTTVYIQGE